MKKEITIDDVRLVRVWPSLSKTPGWKVWFTYDKWDYAEFITDDQESFNKARQKALEAFKRKMK